MEYSKAISGESVPIQAHYALTANKDITFYQYLALCRLIEGLILHQEYWIIGSASEEQPHQDTKCALQFIQELAPETRVVYLSGKKLDARLTQPVKARWHEIAKSVYGSTLGMTAAAATSRVKLDRHDGSLIEKLENDFQSASNTVPWNPRQLAASIYNGHIHNATTPFYRRVMRTHLLTALAKQHNAKLLIGDERVIIQFIQSDVLGPTAYEPFASRLHNLVQSCWLATQRGGQEFCPYPDIPLLLAAVLVGSHSRTQVRNRIAELISETSSFREACAALDRVLSDADASGYDRAEAQDKAQKVLDFVGVYVRYRSGLSDGTFRGMWASARRTVCDESGCQSGQSSLSLTVPNPMADNQVIGGVQVTLGTVKGIINAVKQFGLKEPLEQYLNAVKGAFASQGIQSTALRLLPVKRYRLGSVHELIDRRLRESVRSV
ncbi:MAG: hypothetical protein KF858_11745 [Candidatus Sumerlaeia bacterium]|nr:hypothetical protein [Candidatus Sumerlaeia bacterium]